MSLRVALNAKSLLGESPVWNADDNSVYFIDIKDRKINRFCTLNGSLNSISIPSEVGCIVLNKNGGIVAATQDGITILDFNKPKFEYCCTIDNDFPNNRPNDGKCDAAGRLWITSMDNHENFPSGRLWCLKSRTEKKIMGSNFIIGNGIDWSPDKRKMYFTDSKKRTIFVYDFNLEKGTISNKKVFAIIQDTDGYPDGLIVDINGFVWSAHWDGWRITRYAPDGSLDKIITLPVPRPTSLTFGGDQLSTLFITSASYGLSTWEMKNAPLSGSLFAYESNYIGQPCNRYAG